MSNRSRTEAPPEPTGVLVGATDHTTVANHLLMAGLLADDPSLHESQFTPQDWDRKLDEYGKSVRV